LNGPPDRAVLSLERRYVLLGIAGSLALGSFPGHCAYAQSYDDPEVLYAALRAVNRKSGGNAADWSADDVMAAGDAATGTDVLAGLCADMKAKPIEVDLQGLFEKIGVSNSGGRILFDDRAPLAEFRRRLTQPPNKS
jgi:hypothetical protein